MQKIVEITLIADSDAGIRPQNLTAQTVEIAHVPDTVLTGVDGLVSRGSHPSTIRWFGGTAGDLQGVNRIRIIDNRGVVLIDGELNTHYRMPRDVDGWVIFDVLKSE
jgi:hypothetical protein